MSSEIKVNFVGHFGDDLQHVNAAKASFGRRSEWEVIYCDDYKDQFGSNLVSKKILKPQDKRLLQFLARGLTANDFDKFVDYCINELELNCGIDGYDEFIRQIWQWRDTPEHRSPFNHTFLSFEVEAPIFVARQLVKHEYLPYNEVSGRYIEFKKENVFIPEEFRAKVKDKKQGSGEVLVGNIHDELTAVFTENAKRAFEDYHNALKKGLCEEQARGLLPLNLMTFWRWSGTFGAFAKMLRLRLAPDAQKESQIVAQQIGAFIKPLFPVSYAAMVERNFD